MKKIELDSINTRAPKNFDKQKIKKENKKLADELAELQNKLYAESKWSVLIVLQGLDASGKDSTVRKVFRSVNPQGVRVHSFKKPTETELAHDFLWRIHKHTPEKGMIQIFNRSHYEDVLATRVLKLIDDETAHKRFQIINAFEQLLQENGTQVLKFFLHISKEEQLERFDERLNDPRKHWKYNPDDLKTTANWEKYMKYYQEIFEKCSPEIPWIVVPADQKWYRNYIIATKIIDTLRSLDMKYPGLNE